MEQVFEIKVTLNNVKPPVWRRIIIPECASLVDLHAVIQGAMGWQDSHLHCFEIDGKYYEIMDDNTDGVQDAYLDERRYALKDLLHEGSECIYIYDFGDKWTHTIKIEKLRTAEIHDRFPRYTAGERSCPPEDSGGPYKFPEFIHAFENDEHPEHKSMHKWAGPYDIKLFSISQANALILAFLALYKARGLSYPENYTIDIN